MDSKTKNIQSFTIAEIIYYLYFALMLFAKGMGLQQGQWPYTASLAIAAVLIAAKLVLSKNNLTEWIVILALFALTAVIYLNSGEIGAIILVATIVGMKDVPLKRVMVLGCTVWIFSYVLKMLLVLLGLQNDIFRVQEKLGLGHIIRWSLGQPHPNVLQISYMILCAFLLWVFHWEGKKLIYVSVLMFIGNLYIFMYSISYTGIVLVTLYLCLNLVLHFKKKINNVSKVCFVLLPVACMTFAIVGPVLFKGRLWELCDKVFNSRFTITKAFLEANPINLFGTGFCEPLGIPLNNLDSSYVFCLMRYGVVFFILFFGGYIALVINYIKTDKRKELAIISAMFVGAVSEPFFVNTSFKNISVVFLGAGLYEALRAIREKRTAGVAGSGALVKSSGGVNNKKININLEKLETFGHNFLSAYSANRKKILIVSIAIAAVAACIFGFTKDMPSAYYMNRSNVQMLDKSYITLDINNLPADFDGKILNYTDSETPMMCFSGNMITVEYIRAIVSMGVWVFGFAVGIYTMILSILGRKKE